jgi:methionyl aminopeptidase
LIETTERCFNEAVKLCYPGNTLGDIGNAITTIANFNNFHVAFALSGHGIGKELHEYPPVYNFGEPGSGQVIEVGMSFCIEPIIIAGTHMISEENNGVSDGWTIYSADGSKAAHHEHTIAITEDGPLVLTRI